MESIWKFIIGFVVTLSLIVSTIVPVATAEAMQQHIITAQTTTDIYKEWAINFSKQVDASSITTDNLYIENEQGQKVLTKEPVIEGNKVKIAPVNAYTISETYKLMIVSTIKSLQGQSLTRNTSFTFTIAQPSTTDVVISKAGTYSNQTYEGNVTITVPGVTLENTMIKGNLEIAASVGEGEVYFDNVIVEGETKILGGGANSVYFKDSVLATVIINKHNGSIRVVVEGATVVQEVLLESVAILQEQNITGDGFTKVDIQESAQNTEGTFRLEGTFETINVLATEVQIDLPEATSIEQLVLSAIANVIGSGTIDLLQVGNAAAGSTLSIRPQEAILTIPNNTSITIADETITESYTSATEATIEAIKATPTSIKVQLSQPLYDLTIDDLHVQATVNGEVVPLHNMTYDATTQMIFFTPLSPEQYSYVPVEVVVAANNTSVLAGSATTQFTNRYGFSGRITDIYGNGVGNVSITPAESSQPFERAVTDKHGYYTAYVAEPGVYYATMQAPGYLQGNLVATVQTNKFQTGVNETIIRAAASDEWKIMLTWNGQESDVDSHLATENFHVYYADPVYMGKEGYEYVDLDWDDTEYFGPETTTIRQFQDGRYIFFVHNFSGEHPLSASASKVQVFKGNSAVADYTFTVPANTQDADYWGVFELYVSNNGETIQLQELNTTSNNEDVLISPKQALIQLLEQANQTNIQDLGIDETVFEAALQQANAVLANSQATTKQLVESYQSLAILIPEIIREYSDYGNIELTEIASDNYYYPLNEPIKLTVNTGEQFEHYMNADDVVDFKIHVSHWIYDETTYDSYEQPIVGQTIALTNKTTRERRNYVTDTHGYIHLGQMTYAEFMNLPNYDMEFVMANEGEMDFNFTLEVVNRQDEYGSTISDNISKFYYFSNEEYYNEEY